MKVTARSIGALLAGAALIAAASLLPATLAGAADKPTNSAKLAKPLKEANDDIRRRNMPMPSASSRKRRGSPARRPTTST